MLFFDGVVMLFALELASANHPAPDEAAVRFGDHGKPLLAAVSLGKQHHPVVIFPERVRTPAVRVKRRQCPTVSPGMQDRQPRFAARIEAPRRDEFQISRLCPCSVLGVAGEQ